MPGAHSDMEGLGDPLTDTSPWELLELRRSRRQSFPEILEELGIELPAITVTRWLKGDPAPRVDR